jgi:hypothetical protein
MTKDLKRLLNPYLKSGWTLEHGRKHMKMKAPNGRLVVISNTASCPFYLKHVEADLRRVMM